MINKIHNIVEQFKIDGQIISAEPHGNGHINDTFLVITDHNGTLSRWIVQRINHNVFLNPPALMENIVRVTEHIHSKLKQNGSDNIDQRVLTVIPENNLNSYYTDHEGNYWRIYRFIENAKTYDIIQSLKQAYEAARMFGDFQNMLSDLPSPQLHETIKDFHNGPKRFNDFLETLNADPFNRAQYAKEEIKFVKEHEEVFQVLPKLVKKGDIPLRITHNDSKINNVMLDCKTQKGLCVIDLDTVMPGLSLYDFGDIVRTTISDSAEDERDLSKVFLDMSRFEAITRGYLSSANEFLNKTEKNHLVLGGKMITLIIGVRFLTDYLSGDQYHKIHRDRQNLDRCKTLLKLVSSIEKNQEQMNLLVEKIVKEI